MAGNRIGIGHLGKYEVINYAFITSLSQRKGGQRNIVTLLDT